MVIGCNHSFYIHIFHILDTFVYNSRTYNEAELFAQLYCNVNTIKFTSKISLLQELGSFGTKR